MKQTRHFLLSLASAALMLPLGATAQTALYPRHFALDQVTLLDGPMKTAMERNFQTLMQYDVDRLLTPFVRQSGLAATTDAASPYYQWEQRHPNFVNWGEASFDLSGHVGGHYLSALALASAACHDGDMQARLRERMDYMVGVMKDCQDQYDQNTQGLYGFIGGQPINSDWTALFSGNIAPYRQHGGWVPLYVQHKVLAGLRDAYVYGGNVQAREVFRKLADWSVNLIAKVSDANLQTLLGIEHGGMNESMADAYTLFGDAKYLDAARRYTHKTMLDGMQTMATTFLDGKHANTQVPKYIGMERIGDVEHSTFSVQRSTYTTAAENFWQDVAQNRTVCIGGNSVNEHFLAKSNSNRYIDQLDGPESCNSNNMLKLSEMMFDRTGDAKYADFYENTMWNHILSTQDPTTGGYVYFTTLRPQGYRIYSQVNQGMWCCVGTGMENHSKYGHFIYTHDGAGKLFVNLFTPSRLVSDDFVITQETQFPFEPTTTLTVGKAGLYTIAVRHPAWAGKGYEVLVNHEKVNTPPVEEGVASYVEFTRNWQVGDVVTVSLPMELRYEACPNYTDYIAFKYGPILLGANVSAEGEQLQNEYGGEGRMDHAPGSRATSKSLTTAPLLIGERANVLGRIKPVDPSALTFTIDASRPDVASYQWDALTLQPFYQIHHARYMCYWYQQTAENYANSTMAQTEAEAEALQKRTIDFVAPGEQQSEAGHEAMHSSDSSTGDYNTEHYRDARANGFLQYVLYNPERVDDRLSIMMRFNLADRGRQATLTIDGVKVADITIPSSARGSDANGFYNVEYPIPASLLTESEGGAVKKQFTVRLTASATTLCPGLYYLRLLKEYDAHEYRFVATDWTTGDTWRLQTSQMSYDTERNIINIARTGDNNICLMLNYADHDYTISRDQKYLVVRGTGLKTTSGASYLWWLNGSNHGTQVVPSAVQTVTVGDQEQQVVAWNMTTSGLYENFSGDRPSICMGQTIFGLTAAAANGVCSVCDINFVSDVASYVSEATGIKKTEAARGGTSVVYSLDGVRVDHPSRGVYIANGRKLTY